MSEPQFQAETHWCAAPIKVEGKITYKKNISWVDSGAVLGWVVGGPFTVESTLSWGVGRGGTIVYFKERPLTPEQMILWWTVTPKYFAQRTKCSRVNGPGDHLLRGPIYFVVDLLPSAVNLWHCCWWKTTHYQPPEAQHSAHHMPSHWIWPLMPGLQ